MGTCATSVGDEGGWASVATLRGGGTITKVLRHTQIIDELQAAGTTTRAGRRVWWARYAAQADVVVLNVGHHYHQTDPEFAKYEGMAARGASALADLMKPTAQLVYRTTNVGHHKCEDAHRPLRSRVDAWEKLADGDIWAWPSRAKASATPGGMFKDRYNWRGPPLVEGCWATPAAAAGHSLGGRFAFLNVSFIDARADGHVATAMRYGPTVSKAAKKKASFPLDCLHYCYPGVSDYWALALYNLLLNNERYSHGVA